MIRKNKDIEITSKKIIALKNMEKSTKFLRNFNRRKKSKI
jgi:hypothetical protein